MGYVELSTFAFCKYNGGGLMRRVMFGRLSTRKGVCLPLLRGDLSSMPSMETWLNYFYLYCCPK